MCGGEREYRRFGSLLGHRNGPGTVGQSSHEPGHAIGSDDGSDRNGVLTGDRMQYMRCALAGRS